MTISELRHEMHVRYIRIADVANRADVSKEFVSMVFHEKRNSKKVILAALELVKEYDLNSIAGVVNKYYVRGDADN